MTAAVAFDMSTFVWSHSALDMYNTCPYQFYRIRVTKDVKKDYGEAADKGNKLHKILENYVNKDEPIPPHLETYQKLGDQVKALPGVKFPELRLCMSADLEPVEWTGVWNLGPGAWGVSIADVLIYDALNAPDTAVVIDYKTGKYRGDDGQPARLALATFANYDVDIVKAIFVYTEYNKIAPYVYYREELPIIIEPTLRILTAMKWSAEKGAWPKRESGLCAWCAVIDCPNNTSLSRRKFK